MQTKDTSKDVFHLLTLFGGTGVAISLIVAIDVAVRVFIDPAPFAKSPWDLRWAAFFFALILVSGFLFTIFRGRALIVVTGIAALSMLAITVLRGGAGLAILVLIWWMVAAAGLGSWLLRRMTFGITLLERFLLDTTTGLGGFAILGLVLGVLRLYRPVIAYGLLLLLTIFFVPPFLRSFWSDLVKRTQRWCQTWQSENTDLRLVALIASLLAICAISPYLWSLAPTIRFDALTYHLPVPIAYIQNHAMVDLGTFNSYWAHYAEMLYTYAMLLLGQPLPGLLHLAAGFLTTAWILALGRRLAGIRVGLLAGLLFLSLPMVSYETGTVYVDLFVALFIIAMVASGVFWWQLRENRWLVVVGSFAGIALGIKLTAAPLVLVFGLFLISALFLRYRRFAPIAAGCLGLAVPAILLAAPWLVRDWLWTGNPVYPFFNSLFPAQRVLGSSTVGFKKIDAAFWIRTIRLPWDLTFNIRTYYHESPGAALGALPFLALPWLYLWIPDYSSRQRRWFATLTLGTIAAMVLLFNLNSVARYQIPLYALFAIFAALNLESAWRLLSRTRIRRIAAGLSLALLLVYVFSTRLALIVRVTDFPQRFPVKLFLGMENDQAFLSRSLPVYDAFQYLNRNNAGQHKVLSIGNEFKLYTDSQINGVILTPEAYQLASRATDAASLAARLAQDGYDYLLVNQAEVEYSPASYNFPALNQDFYSHYTDLEFASHRVYLYRLYPNSLPASLQPENLLQNSGFEQADASGQAAGWTISGHPRLDLSGGQAHSGLGAIELHGPIPQASYSLISQQVPVEAGKAYTVGYWARANTPVSLQLQIQWLDADSNPIREEVQWRPLQVQWSWYTLASQAPDNASFARIFASVTGGDPAWFDDLCFTRGGNCPNGGPVYVAQGIPSKP